MAALPELLDGADVVLSEGILPFHQCGFELFDDQLHVVGVVVAGHDPGVRQIAQQRQPTAAEIESVQPDFIGGVGQG